MNFPPCGNAGHHGGVLSKFEPACDDSNINRTFRQFERPADVVQSAASEVSETGVFNPSE